MRAPDPLALVVERHPLLEPAVDLHIGGVQVDRHIRRQRPSAAGVDSAEHVEPGGVHVTEPGLHRRPLPLGDPAGQAGGGCGRQPRHRRERLPRTVGAVPVEPDQEVLPAQLRRGHADQHLPGAEPAVPILDRSHRGVELVDDPEPFGQLGHRGQPGEPGQRLVWRADLHPRAARPLLAYCSHLIGVLSTCCVVSSQTRSSQVSGHLSSSPRSRHHHYSRIRVRRLTDLAA